MRVESSSSIAAVGAAQHARMGLGGGALAAMLLLNALPLAHLLACILVPFCALSETPERIALGIVMLYLVPPLAARLVLFLSSPIPSRTLVGGGA